MNTVADCLFGCGETGPWLSHFIVTSVCVMAERREASEKSL